jgi:hypothetical protein
MPTLQLMKVLINDYSDGSVRLARMLVPSSNRIQAQSAATGVINTGQFSVGARSLPEKQRRASAVKKSRVLRRAFPQFFAYPRLGNARTPQ